MLFSPSLKELLEHVKSQPDTLCCILFAPLFSKVAKEGVMQRLGYLNNRSARNVHFYCAGYGAYWPSSLYPDIEEMGEHQYEDGIVVTWQFSQKAFATFVDEMESATTWRYGGETEMIVLNPNSSFEDVLVLDIEAMVKDGALDRPSELFELIFRYSREDRTSHSAFSLSDSRIPSIFGKTVLDALAVGPKAIGKAWKSGRHFAVKSIAK